MARVSASFDTETGLLSIKVTGMAGYADVVPVIRVAYPKYPQAPVLWDFPAGAFSTLELGELKEISGVLKALAPYRTGARTAFILRDQAENRQMKLYVELVRLQKVSADYRIFEDRDEAVDWLLDRNSEARTTDQ